MLVPLSITVLGPGALISVKYHVRSGGRP